MGGFHHANHHVSTGNLSGLGGMGSRSLGMSRCGLCSKMPHNETLARKRRWVSFTKNAHQECDLQISWWYTHQDTTQNKCSNARQEHLRIIMSNKVSEATSLKDHGGCRVHHKTTLSKYNNVHHLDLPTTSLHNGDNIKNSDWHDYKKDTWRDADISITTV